MSSGKPNPSTLEGCVHTWLSPYATVWRRIYPDASVPFAQLARALAPLVKAHPEDRITAELCGYLRKTEPRYVNVAKFAATFGSWAKPEPVKSRPSQYQSVDEADRKAGIPLESVAQMLKARGF